MLGDSTFGDVPFSTANLPPVVSGVGNRRRRVICGGSDLMQWLKQSTAFTSIVGPILDSTGVEYASAVIGDLSITKNGTTAAMASAATLTYISNGYYTLVGTTGNSDTAGRLDITCNKSTYQMPQKTFTVLVATVFDALVTNATTAAGGLGDIQRMAGTALTGRDIGASVLLSNGTGTGQLKLASGYVAMTWADVASPTTALALTGTTISATQKVDVDTIKTNPVVNAGTVTFPTTATLASTTNITAGTITTVTTVTNQLTAAAIATGAWTDTTAGDFTTALSVGKSIMNGVTLGTGLTVARCTLTDTLTTYTGNTVQTGDSFARIGATGSGLTSLAPSSTALSTAQWSNALATNLGTTNTTVASNLDATVSSRLASASYTAPTNLTAAQIATGVWTDTTSGDFTTALSVGKSIMNGVTLGTGLTVARCTLTDTLTTYTGNTVQTGDSFARIGATGSGLTSLAASSTALSTAQWTNTLATNLGTTNTTVASNLDAAVSSRMATYTQPTGFLAATFPATVASTTNITAGTITTVTTVTNQLTAAQIATGVWQDSTAGDFTTANSIGKSLYNSFTAGTSVFTVAALANAPVTAAGPSAATIATAVWTDTTASDFTTALSVGKSVMNGVTLGTGLTVARVTLTDTLTTYTGNTVQTGDSFARIGATGSGLSSLAPASTALSTVTWTGTLATNIGTTNTTVASNLDAAVSSRGTSTLTQTQVTGGAYSVQSASCVLGDARIANLDGTVTSRMATYTQPTGFLAANFTTGIPISGDLSATMKTSVTTAATAATPVVTISGVISTLSALNTSLSSTHGAGSWATATGFSTLVAADIVSNGAITTASGAVSSVGNVTQLGGSNVVHTLGKLWVLDSSGNAIAPASATTAIQAKTDNLPSDPADESLIIAATDAIMGRLGAPAGASVSADIADLPTNAELATALGTSDDATLAAVEVLRKLLRADHYIDNSVVPWALVYMQEGTGGIGAGVELFRKQLKSVTGSNLVSTDTVVGQAKT